MVVTIPDVPPLPGAEALHEVRVLRAPVRVWDRASQHTAELMREFTLLRLLDAADDYCTSGDQLMTLVSPPGQQAFRRWYLLEFVRQLEGQPPLPWPGPTD